jgi:hypothetical protein
MPAPESVVLETSLGNIQLELYWDHAPRVCLERPFLSTRPTTTTPLIEPPIPSPDLRQLCTAGQTRILQWRDISSNRRRTFRIFYFLKTEIQPNGRVHFVYPYEKDFMVQGGDPTGTGKGGTSIYGQKLYVSLNIVYLHMPTLKMFFFFLFFPAKTRFTQNYDSPVQGSSPWPTRALTPTVR